MSLTDKQEAFCQEYLKDLNATQASIRAGYSEDTARQIASENLSKPDIQDRVQQLMDERSKRVANEADSILEELKRLGYSDVRIIFDDNGRIKDPKEWPEDLARAVQSIEVFEEFQGKGSEREFIGYTKKVRFWDKPKSLELLGRHKKLFTDKVEHSGSLGLEVLTDEQLEAKRQEILGRLEKK